MSFNADKKREHEAAAEAALCEKNYAKAFFHTAKAAEFGFKLAEQSEGKVAEQYVEDAYELLDIAEKLQDKAKTQPREEPKKAQEKAGPDEDVSQSQWELKDRPREKLADVAGLEDVKTELREKVIEPFLHPEVHERFKLRRGGGILMYGPPGNGKTYIAKAIAGELDAAFFNVNASQIKDKYVGETEKNMQHLFDEARKHDRSVIFLDEVDAILARRGNRKIGMVTQFLTLTDGLVESKNCMLVLGATNKPWLLDPAVLRPGRLGDHIYVGPPDAPAREAIVRLSMEGVPVAGRHGVVVRPGETLREEPATRQRQGRRGDAGGFRRGPGEGAPLRDARTPGRVRRLARGPRGLERRGRRGLRARGQVQFPDRRTIGTDVTETTGVGFLARDARQSSSRERTARSHFETWRLKRSCAGLASMAQRAA